MTPDELMTAYRDELAKLYGRDFANATYLSYARGWFYVSHAHRRPDLGNALIRGSAGAATAYRRKPFEARLDTLKRCSPPVA